MATIPTPELGVPYSYQITTLFGTPPLTFFLQSGTLPTGITLSSTGLLSGTATEAGLFTFTIGITDANGNTVYLTCGFDIDGPEITILGAPSTPVPCEFLDYLGFSAIGGTPPYTWSVDPGAVAPNGRTVDVGPQEPFANSYLDPVTAEFQFDIGNIRPLGHYEFTVRVTDSSSIPVSGTKLIQWDVTCLDTGFDDVVFSFDNYNVFTTLPSADRSNMYAWAQFNGNITCKFFPNGITPLVGAGELTRLSVPNNQINRKQYLVLDQGAATSRLSPISWGDPFIAYPSTWSDEVTPLALRMLMRYPPHIPAAYFWAVDQLANTANIYRSADGITWTALPVPGGANRKWNQMTMVFNGASWRHVVVGSAADGKNAMYTDDDGATWNLVTTGVAGDFRDIAQISTFGSVNSYLIAVGVAASGAKAMISSDYGATWAALAMPVGWTPVTPRITKTIEITIPVAGTTFPTLLATGGNADDPSDVVAFAGIDPGVDAWTQLTTPVLSGGGSSWKAVAGRLTDGFAFSYGLAIIVGTLGMISSVNGIDDWEQVQLCEYPFPQGQPIP